jgi:hypothetical protein
LGAGTAGNALRSPLTRSGAKVERSKTSALASAEGETVAVAQAATHMSTTEDQAVAIRM